MRIQGAMGIHKDVDFSSALVSAVKYENPYHKWTFVFTEVGIFLHNIHGLRGVVSLTLWNPWHTF
jgi:hypothetical protein